MTQFQHITAEDDDDGGDQKDGIGALVTEALFINANRTLNPSHKASGNSPEMFNTTRVKDLWLLRFLV